MSTLDNLHKAAKRWLRALRNGDAEARGRLARSYPGAPEQPTLRDVQHALARERGYENWAALKKAIADRATPGMPLIALLEAAGKGDATGVAAILDEQPDLVNQRGTLPGNTGLRTALHFGVGHEAVVKTLLDRGADPNMRDEGDSAYPIHFAAERGDLAIVRLLVEHGADPIGHGTAHELDVVGWAVCFDYAYHADVARYLLEHGAKYTLFSAVALGQPVAIHELVRSGADLNARMDRTNHRRTALHLAVVKRQAASLAALIDLGVDLNLQDAAGLTPLDQAALDGDAEMARLLISAGATITLPAAIALDRPGEIERLVRADPEILSTTDNRRWASLLVQASRRAPGAVLDRLLRTIERHRSGLTIVNMEAGAETAPDGAGGYTALHEAAFHGNIDAIRVLLKHGAHPRARDGKYCGTPAGWARYAGHAAAADLILEADVDIFDAIDADRGDVVARIVDRDPGALDRPFHAYTSCGPRDVQWWPEPACTPFQWARSQNKLDAARVLVERGAATRTPDDLERAERVVAFLQSACWDHHTHGKGDHRMHDRAAQRILAHHPEIARDSLYTAIVCGEIDEVRRILDARPEAAREAGGSRGWTPILYLAYTRFSHPQTLANAGAMARLLLDAGANPNDFYMAGDARYSVLTGVAGEGEQDSPRQPYARDLFGLLLERGAEPFDIQVLYDTHFSGEVLWWLELVYTHTIDSPRGAAWKDPDWPMLDMGGYGSGARFLLWIAMEKRNLQLAEWLLARGANPNGAAPRARQLPQRSLFEEALRRGFPEMADLLATYGATRTTPVFDAEEEFIQACFRLDRETVRAAVAAHPGYLRSTSAIFVAARRDRADVVALLLEAGVPIEIEDPHKARPLHHAAANNALSVARLLVDRGAEIDPRETQWGATPIGWAAHADKTEMVEYLSRYSRAIWTLCFCGYVNRVREILSEQPDLARQLDHDGCTPLWWLPDDEQQAMAVVELLLAAGADPAVKSGGGRTAADWARRRGMLDVAARLETATREARADGMGGLSPTK